MTDVSQKPGLVRAGLERAGRNFAVGICTIVGAGAFAFGLYSMLPGLIKIDADMRAYDEMRYTVSTILEPKNPIRCYEFLDPSATNPEASKVGIVLPTGEKMRVLSSLGKGAQDCPDTHFALRVENIPKISP